MYIPLGGNRKGKLKQYRNLAIVWLLTGFWHGASWNFIIWGVYFLILLVIEKTFLLKALEKAPAFVSHVYSLFFIAIGWLIFYYTDTSAGWNCLTAMFGAGSFTNPVVTFNTIRLIPTLLVFCVAATPLPKKLWYFLMDRNELCRVITTLLLIAGLLLCTAYMVSSSYSPFLYWNF